MGCFQSKVDALWACLALLQRNIVLQEVSGGACLVVFHNMASNDPHKHQLQQENSTMREEKTIKKRRHSKRVPVYRAFQEQNRCK